MTKKVYTIEEILDQMGLPPNFMADFGSGPIIWGSPECYTKPTSARGGLKNRLKFGDTTFGNEDIVWVWEGDVAQEARIFAIPHPEDAQEIGIQYLHSNESVFVCPTFLQHVSL